MPHKFHLYLIICYFEKKPGVVKAVEERAPLLYVVVEEMLIDAAVVVVVKSILPLAFFGGI